MKRKPGYHIVDLEMKCSCFTPGSHSHSGGEHYHYHLPIWLPIALRWDNISDWIDKRDEKEIEGLLVEEVSNNE